MPNVMASQNASRSGGGKGRSSMAMMKNTMKKTDDHLDQKKADSMKKTDTDKATASVAPKRASVASIDEDGGKKHEETDELVDTIGGPREAEAEKKYKCVDSPCFNGAIMLGILANAAQMGLEIEFTGGVWTSVWTVCEYFFTIFFFIEMVLKFWFMGCRDYFSQRSNWLDFVVVITAIMDNFFFVFVIENDSEVGFISILRLVRLARILKLLRGKKELMMLIEGILSSIRSMFWLSILLSILVYTVAILFVKFIGDSDAYEDDEFDQTIYFGDLQTSMVTGLNLALMSDWDRIFRPVLKLQPHMALFLMLYTGISCFGIMNAIIGVIVSRTAEAAKAAEEEEINDFRELQMDYIEHLKDVIYEIDEDGNGTVSAEEMAQASENEEIGAMLEPCEFPAGFNMAELHCMLDKDGDGELTEVEFIQGMRRLIFCNDFQSNVLIMLAVAQQKRKLYKFKCETEEAFVNLHSEIKKLPDKFKKMLDEHVPARSHDSAPDDFPDKDKKGDQGQYGQVQLPGVPVVSDSEDGSWAKPVSAAKPGNRRAPSPRQQNLHASRGPQLDYDARLVQMQADARALVEQSDALRQASKGIEDDRSQMPQTHAEGFPLLPGIVSQHMTTRSADWPMTPVKDNETQTIEASNDAFPPNISNQMSATAPGGMFQHGDGPGDPGNVMQNNQQNAANQGNNAKRGKKPNQVIKECIV